MSKADEKLNRRMAAIMSGPAVKPVLPKAKPKNVSKGENRGSERVPSYKICEVRIADGSLLKCVMRNISDGGAMLTGDGTGGIPQVATLVVPASHEVKSFEVMWRRHDQVGIRFLG